MMDRNHPLKDASSRPWLAGPVRLGNRVVDGQRGVLLDARGAPVELRPQVWAVLQHLVRNAGRVVTREELLDAVWPGLVVTDGSITQAISDVRAALGDAEHRIVKTMQRRGYMLMPGEPAEAAATHGVDTEPAIEAAQEPDGGRASDAVAVRSFRLHGSAVDATASSPRHMQISLEQRRVLIDGNAAALGGRAFDLLAALMERRDRVVGREELFALVWPGRVVEDHNLGAQVLALRKLLGNDAISTVPGRGYRFALTPVDEAARPDGAKPLTSTDLSDPFVLRAPPVLLGRDDDLAALQDQLVQHRHVTVLGAGGIGKTVLALAAAHARRGEQRDGVAWVDLSSLSQPSLVPIAVAQAMRLAVRGDHPVAALVAGLASREALLLLDNAEHLVDAVAQLTDAIGAGAPGMRMLVTSQVALKVERERLFRLGPLAVPATGTPAAAAMAFGAVALFVDQAQAADPRFALSDGNVDVVIGLCRQLDGLALAIKLAAARVVVLGLPGVEQRLADRLKLLAGTNRSAPTRQQTLRAALDWSYSLASAGEQATFRRLGVFAGGSGFSLELAKAVAGEDPEDEWIVIEHVSALVDRSLVAVDCAEPPRYRLLESAREYALLKLDEHGELQATQHRLARAMLAAFKRYGTQVNTTPDAVLLATYACELDNLRSALDWSSRFDPPLAVELLGRSGAFHVLMALQHEHRKRCEALEPAVGPDISAEIAGRYWQSRAGSSLPAIYTILDCARKAVALYRAANFPTGVYSSLMWIGWCGPSQEWDAAQAELDRIEQHHSNWPPMLRVHRLAATAGGHMVARRFAEARRAAEEAMLFARSVGARRMAALAENYIVAADLELGHIAEALERSRALIERERAVFGGLLELSYARYADGLLRQGDLEAARDALAEFFRQCRITSGERFPIHAHLCVELAIRERRYAAAARLLGHVRAESLREGTTLPSGPVRREHAALQAKLADAFDAPTLHRLMTEGAALDREGMFALTLEREPPVG